VRLPAKAGLHDEIVRVSIQLGSELGEDGLTMRAIAARLGVSATALYQHFESKAAILREIRFLGVRTLLEAMTPAFAAEDPTTRVVEAATRYVEFATGNPWLYKVLFHDEEVDWAQLSDDERGRLMAPLEETRKAFTYGVECGTFYKDLDVPNAALLLWASMHGLASLLISGRLSEAHPAYPIPNRDQFVRGFVETLVRSVTA
jgi:AcrR family transcriptional regulator